MSPTCARSTTTPSCTAVDALAKSAIQPPASTAAAPSTATSTAPSAATNTAAPTTPALAPTRGSRRGTAARVVVMVREAYSLVTAITPSAPARSCAALSPSSAPPAGSGLRRWQGADGDPEGRHHADPDDAQHDAGDEPRRERRLRNLIHSAVAIPRGVTRTAGRAGDRTVVLMRQPFPRTRRRRGSWPGRRPRATRGRG